MGGHLVVLKYLSREILFVTFGIIGLLMLILMSAQVVKLLESAVSGEISLEMVLILAGTQIAVLLELIIPLGSTLGVLLSFGRLKEDSELAVMHASGFSNARLFGLISVSSIGVAICVALFSLVLTPASNLYKEKQKQVERELTVFDTIQPGRFQTDRKGRLLFAQSLSDDRATLLRVFIADERGNRSKEFRYIFADSATQEVQDDGKFLVLSNGTQYRGERGDQTWGVTEFERYLIRIDSPVALRADPFSARSTASLIGASDAKSQAELAWRVSVPLVGLVMLPLVFVIARGSHRVNRFVWIIPVILIQFAFVSALMTARQLTDANSVWLHYASIHGVFLGLAAALLSLPAVDRLRAKVMT